MLKKNKIHSKENAKTFKQCVLQLKEMKEENCSVGKLDMSNSNESTRTTESFVLSTEIRNAWGQKDINSILKEKDERLKYLENELEERKSSYQKLEQEKKKARAEFEKEQKDANFEKALREKDCELTNLLIDCDIHKRRISELEAQLQLEKSASEVLKDASKYIADISTRKPVAVYKRDYAASLKEFIENEAEIKKFQALSLTAERELSSLNTAHKECRVLIRNLESVITDLENRLKFKTFSKEIEMNDIETVLMEEIGNITSAYDKISSTNMELEKSLLSANSKISEISDENFSFKNRIGHFEDSKVYFEKEKKRLEEWKSTLAEETKIFQEKCFEMENSMLEKDKKIVDYKILITNLQANYKILENELGTANSSYRIAKRELEVIKADFLHLKTENESNKKLCELFKGFCTSDVEVIEELERYKKVLRCSLCDTNIKNCVLIKCSHTFCNSCLDDRLKARQRKCPICQTEFSSNDMKKLFL